MKLLLLPALLAVALTARAEAPWGDSDHQLFLRIETEPPAAILRTVTEDGSPGIEIGRTPNVFSIDLKWSSNLFGKRWSRLRAKAPGGIATTAYDATNRTHDLLVTFAVEKDGFLPEVVNELVTVLKRSGDDWEDAMENLPAQRKLVVHLKPAAPQGNLAAGLQPVRTVIVAAGDGEDLGTIDLSASTGRVVQVDGLPAGRTPLRIMTHSGLRVVTTPGTNGAAARHEVKVEAGRTTGLDLGE